jgi:hypothetical protein
MVLILGVYDPSLVAPGVNVVSMGTTGVEGAFKNPAD